MDPIEVSQHTSPKSCWIVVERKVYDVTSFLGQHPGGPSLILKYAGADATEAFNEVHTQETLDEHLTKDQHLGELKEGAEIAAPKPKDVIPMQRDDASKAPPLSTIVLLEEFEHAAKCVMAQRAWTYVSSSSNNEQTLRGYKDIWSSLKFRPRVLQNVTTVNPATSILSQPCRLPIFIPPTGVVGSVHPDGELLLSRAAARSGVHYCVSSATTRSHEAIAERFEAEKREAGSAADTCCLFFQLYVNADRKITQEKLREVQRLGYKGLFLTVDTNVIGKRWQDRKMQALELLDAGLNDGVEIGGRPAAGTISISLNWDDIAWIRESWPGPLVLKGIQHADDAKKALDIGLQGVYLSNHGGRQMRSAPSSFETLLDIREQYPEVMQKMQVFVDGGFSTGSDILKAVALGATAVGIGRPFLYAAAAYGPQGVERAIDILTEEIEMGMRLCGVTELSQLRPEMVRTGLRDLILARL